MATDMTGERVGHLTNDVVDNGDESPQALNMSMVPTSSPFQLASRAACYLFDVPPVNQTPLD